jgi:predicted Zn-dependent protease
MQEYFFEIAEVVSTLLAGAEVFTSSFSGEESDFVRFNRGETRQAGNVVQRHLTVDLVEGLRHAAGTLTLTGDFGSDVGRLRELVAALREMRVHLPEDPYLSYATEVRSTERVHRGELPDRQAVLASVRDAGRGRDLVGVYAAGTIHRGFANSLGQRNWYGNQSFNLDWSFFHRADKGVKASYAGFAWSDAAFARTMAKAGEQLEALARPALTISPGRYRVCLAPVALGEILSVLAWGGFGLRAHRTKTTPLVEMIEAGARLHPSVQITENTRAGFAPDFQEAGFIRPPQVSLIRDGVYDQCLVSPRSALEYGVETNGAVASEVPLSLEVGAGQIPTDSVLAALGRGISVGNLWYVNFSDRSACRMTGMTRFATFWVEDGAIHAPLNVMRFDETLYRLLGENLIGLTIERETLLDPGTYHARSTASARLPGVLVEDFTFTL